MFKIFFIFFTFLKINFVFSNEILDLQQKSEKFLQDRNKIDLQKPSDEVCLEYQPNRIDEINFDFSNISLEENEELAAKVYIDYHINLLVNILNKHNYHQ